MSAAPSANTVASAFSFMPFPDIAPPSATLTRVPAPSRIVGTTTPGQGQ
ncbi:MAG: hypothetical protein R3E56_03330 [Burkholderiaceae bacterium]